MQRGQMLVEALVRPCDQAFVETLLRYAGFIAGDQQDRLPIRIESVGDSPYAPCRVEAQLLHIRMFRPRQRVGARPLHPRPCRFEKLRHRQQFVLDGLRKAIEFGPKDRMKSDGPGQIYTLEYICIARGIIGGQADALGRGGLIAFANGSNIAAHDA